MRMRYVAGLGNPGGSYENTRHNAGFLAVDFLAEKLGLRWKEEASMRAMVAQGSGLCLIKPLTFMNESGSAIRSALSFYEGNSIFTQAVKKPEGLTELTVIYDDLDVEVGDWKRQFAKHPKIHNGVNSVIEELGTELFWNVRIGVDGRKGDRSIPPDKYVLMSWTKDEQALLAPVLQSVVQEVHATIASS